MTSHDEFLSEARRVEAIGALFADEHRRAAAIGRTLPPRVITTFLTPTTIPQERWIEADMLEGGVEYRFIEATDRSRGPGTLFACDSAYDLLVEADEFQQKEKLRETLAPLVERQEFETPADAALIDEVETLIEIGELDPVLRLRTRADIVELLGGRLEPSVFVASVVERRTQRRTRQESLTLNPASHRMIEEL